MSFYRVCGILCVLSLFALPGNAADENSKATTEDEVQKLRIEIKKLDSQDKLEGRIEQTAADSVSRVKELITSVKHLKRSTFDVFCEVQREDLVAVGEPNVIGPIIVPAIPAGSGLLGTGEYLPVRKKWIDHYMAQIERLYPMVTKDLEGLKLSDDVDAKAKEHYKNMVLNYNKLGPALKSLDSKTLGPKYDNQVIAKASAIAQNYIDKLEKESKRLYKELRRLDRNAKNQEKKTRRKLKKEKRDLEKKERKLEKES